jgi:ferritin-like metal-binding protein YciE
MKTLQDVYYLQLQDAHSACKQSLAATTELGRAAEDKGLSEALIAGANGISDGMDKLKSLCAEHDLNPNGHHCGGMEGLVKEAREHAIEDEFGNPDARDAMIIAQYQRMAHYAIAAYGTLRAYANRLDLDGDAATLTEMLDSAYDGDRTMTEIATGKDGINADAKAA